MAIQKKYPKQLPFVATETQYDKVEKESNDDGVSMAEIIRRCVDEYFGLVNGESQVKTENRSH